MHWKGKADSRAQETQNIAGNWPHNTRAHSFELHKSGRTNLEIGCVRDWAPVLGSRLNMPLIYPASHQPVIIVTNLDVKIWRTKCILHSVQRKRNLKFNSHSSTAFLLICKCTQHALGSVMEKLRWTHYSIHLRMILFAYLRLWLLTLPIADTGTSYAARKAKSCLRLGYCSGRRWWR